MELNNKGFAISGVLYSLLILFITLFVGTLTIFASTKFSFDKIKNDIINKLEKVPTFKLVLDYQNYDVNVGSISSINYLDGSSVLNKGEVFETEITYELPSNFSLSTAGQYEILYKAVIDGEEITNTRNITVKPLETTTYNYKGSANQVIIDKTGLYKLEAWGAQGGYRNSTSYGGKGGYATGLVNLKKDDKLYIYVGGAGGTGTSGCGDTICPGGFNGGGYRHTYYGGGGGSDIRINNDSLYARVLVAGGGGSDGATSKKGMYGGGTSGGSSTESFTSVSSYGGKGGTQTFSGYSKEYTITNQTTTGLDYNALVNYAGGFGFGGGGVYCYTGYGGAGGGGWYGGSGNVPDSSSDDDRGGGGGSGWTYTASNYSTWSSANNTESANWLLDSYYYLENASTIGGNSTMPSPTSSATITGNTGNGYVKITPYVLKY